MKNASKASLVPNSAAMVKSRPTPASLTIKVSVPTVKAAAKTWLSADLLRHTDIRTNLTIYLRKHEGRFPVQSVKYIVAQTSGRSEEHTSELQSLMRISYAVFCLKQQKTIQ